MITNNNNWYSPLRSIEARVELYNGSTLVDTYTPSRGIKSFTIDRIGESNKFFGYGICQKLSLHLVDKERVFNISKENSFKVFLGAGAELIGFPTFYVEDVKRDENTNELSITAYDALYSAVNHKVNEARIVDIYTPALIDYLMSFAEVLGITFVHDELADFTQLLYPEGANFDDNDDIRLALDAAAEAVQKIYYIDSKNQLSFKSLNKELLFPVVERLDRNKYFTLKSGDNKTLGLVVKTTELGDGITPIEPTTGVIEGETQYIRDNGFLDMREDLASWINAAQANIGGFTLAQFNCEWRGNPALEIGDKIELVTKDDEIITSFVLNDVITYDGSLKQVTQWEYKEGETERVENPASLGEFLKKTSAKVDKVNQRITLEVAETNERLSQLEVDTNGIRLSVEGIAGELAAANEELEELTKKAELMITEENVEIIVKQELNNGVEKVVTAEKRYKFDDTGLNISAEGEEISTKIDNNGMEISKDTEVVLTANNTGVNARNLHAVTYLIIGSNSRLEDMANGRTGCFWIGG